MRKRVIIVSIVLVAVIGCCIWWFSYGKASLYHQKISVNDIEEILIHHDLNTIWLDKTKYETFVQLFNKAAFIKDNDNGNGTTSVWGIDFQLKSGKWIGVSEYGDVLEVQRSDNVNLLNRDNILKNSVYYYISSNDLTKLIKNEFEAGR
ncbi:hypothetical protein [Paenibacillus sp. KN14-4R]|uniref:hypothetical protein n=1 Tax=Paenibacillus sp. KN14-4R TaxID=3445773 RepID=UPI003F9F55DF